MHSRRARAGNGGSLATAHGLVVRPPVTTEGEVVERSLPLSRGVTDLRDGPPDRIRDALAGFNVAGAHGARPGSIDHGAFRRDHIDHPGNAPIGRNVGRHQAPHDEEGGGPCDRDRAVDIAGRGRRGSGEVDGQAGIRPLQRHHDRQVALLHPVALHDVPSGKPATRNPLHELPPDATLGVVEQFPPRLLHVVEAVSDDQLPIPIGAPGAGRGLGGEIPPPHCRRTHVGEHDPLDVGTDPSCGRPAHRRKDQALLKDLGRVRGHAAGPHPTHVRVMGANHGIPHHRALEIDGVDHRDVGQVRTAGKRIVENEGVTGVGTERDHGAHRVRHGAEMNRDVSRLRHHLPVNVEERGRRVPSFTDVW